MALTKVKLIADGTIVQSHLNASHGITTADIGENASYLYYTDARARAAVSVSGNALSYNSSTGVITSNYEESPTFTGTVGIGAAPSQGKLDILNNGDYDSHTGHGLAINSNASNAYTSMYMGADDSIDAAYIQSAGRNTSFTTKNLLLNPNGGNVGIGYTSPASVLHVGSTGTNAYSATITKGSNMKGIINTLSNNANDMVGIYFATGSTTEGTHWSGITGSRTDSTSHWGTQLNFYTHNNDVANINDATQKMVIKGDGNVGIGTNLPSATKPTGSLIATGWGISDSKALEISASNFANSGLFLRNSDNATGTDITSDNYYGNTFIDNRYDNDNGDIYFRTRTAGTPQIRMIIEGGGNVGIGTTSPESGAKLDVRAGAGGKVVFGSYDANYKAVIEAGDQLNFYNGTSATTAYINYSQTGTPGDVLLSRNLLVEANSSGGVSGTVRIKSNGSVGIGTTSPGGKLDVVHPNSGTDETRKEIQRWLHDGQNAMSLFAYGNTADTIQLAAWGSEQNISIVTETLGSITKNTTKGIYIKSGGNVGIGTVDPAEKLEVEGSSAIIKVESTTAGANANIHFQTTARKWGVGPNMAFGSSDFEIYDYTAGQNRLVIDSSGKIGIGASSPDAPLTVYGGTGLGIGASGIRVHRPDAFGQYGYLDYGQGSSTTYIGSLYTGGSATNYGEIIFRQHSNGGSPRETLRVGDNNFFKVSNNGSYFSTTGNYHEMNQSAANNWSYILHNSSNSPYGIYIAYSGASPNNAQEIIYFADTTQQRFYVTSAGAVYGNGTYGTISDQKLKENIIDATPKLDDINKLKVRNFNFKDKPEEKHIGFIAQEFEEVFPSMIETTQDKDDDNNLIEGSYTKTIKSSILIPILVKSIQELKADNDSLRARIEILENN